MHNLIETARQRLQDGGYTCVVLCGEREYVSRERGVKPLLALLDAKTPCVGAVAADKTVGAGAAYLYVLLGVRALWANVISEAAMRVLKRHGIEAVCGECVPHIINRRGDGICPIETAVADATSAEEACRLIKAALAWLADKSPIQVTYIHHSGFLAETARRYYLFDYEKGDLPRMDTAKPIYVLSSHAHSDHYNPAIFSMLEAVGMQSVRAILSDDIAPPDHIDVLRVSAGEEYALENSVKLTTLRSTDEGVAFLIEDNGVRIYHAGDLNDWVWDEESDDYNRQMTADYREQIDLLAEILQGQELDAAFVVLDPRQEQDYARGLVYFLEHIPAKRVYPMHFWDEPDIIQTFSAEYPAYCPLIQHPQ